MNITVTGSRGYLGSAVCTQLRDGGYDVTGLDNDATSRVDEIPGTTQYHFDVSDYAAIETFTRRADVVVHLAAVPGINQCREDPRVATDANVVATANVAAACAETNTPLVFASTIGVYGSAEFVDDTQPRDPSEFYMQTKRAGEDIIAATARLAYPAIAFQMTNLYGHHTVADDTVAKPTAVNYFVEQARSGDPITVHEPGTQTRDFLHVADAADAYLRAVDQIDMFGRAMESIPLARGETHAIEDVAACAQSASPHDVSIEVVEHPGSPRSTGDVYTAKAADRLGWRATGSVEAYVEGAVQAGMTDE